MNTSSFKDDHISQILALQLLQKLGHQYLMCKEALQLRVLKKESMQVLLTGKKNIENK